MTLLVIDIGGSAIKYGLYNEGSLSDKGSIETPETWEEMQEQLLKIKDSFSDKHVQGVAISAPGAVDTQVGIIKGASAVPYIHHFDIVTELEILFSLPVSIENDASCAALAESSLGVAKDVSSALFFIIGSGVGGAVVLDNQLVKGPNLFGGEFGYMFINDHTTLSEAVSPVTAAKRFSKTYLDNQEISGKELFELALTDNLEAQKAVDDIYDALALGIFNTLVVLNPEMVAIGGAMSKEKDLIEQVSRRIDVLLDKTNANDLQYQLKICQFQNDANLLGAAVHFLNQGE